MKTEASPTHLLLGHMSQNEHIVTLAEQRGFNTAAGVSDYFIARELLGITVQQMSQWRRSRNQMGNARVIQCCELMRLEPAETLQWISRFEEYRAQRAQNERAAQFWHAVRMAKASAVALALVVITTAAGLLPAPAEASPAANDGASYKYYVKWLLAWLRRLAAAARPPSQAAYAVV